MGIAHPRVLEVPVSTGLDDGTTRKVRLRKWTMAQRAELKPKVLAVLDRIVGLQGGISGALSSDLVQLFMEVEDEIVDVVRASISREELSDADWDAMDWSDAPDLAFGLWELNITGAGGIMGKAGAALGAMFGNALIAAAEQKVGGATTTESSTSPTPKSSMSLRPVGSLSSPDDGEQTQRA